MIVIAGALTLISAVMFATSYTAIRALRGQQSGSFLLKPLRGWQVALLLINVAFRRHVGPIARNQ